MFFEAFSLLKSTFFWKLPLRKLKKREKSVQKNVFFPYLMVLENEKYMYVSVTDTF